MDNSTFYEKYILTGVGEKFEKQIEVESSAERNYIDKILSDYPFVSVETIAEDYGFSTLEMNDFMYRLGIQYPEFGQWLLKPQYLEKGYTVTIKLYDDGHQIGYRTLWTKKGRLFLYELFKKYDIFPTIEREDD